MLFRVLGIFAILPSILFAFPTTLDEDHAEELEHEFQGDMIISQAELDAFNGRIDENLRWPGNIVPYYIEPTHFSKLQRKNVDRWFKIYLKIWWIFPADQEQIDYIHKAASTLNTLTACVHLQNRTNQADYITVSGDATGCSSYVKIAEIEFSLEFW